MADDIKDLDGSPIFDLDVNTAEDISSDFIFFRNVFQYKGTVKRIESYSDDTLKSIKIDFLFVSKEEEYKAINFFHQQKGQLEKFWYIPEYVVFNLASQIGSVDTSMTVESNHFDKVFTGKERIAIRMRNKDKITRKITGINDLGNGLISLQTDHQFGRVISPDSIFGVYECIPMRFDEESFTVKSNNREVSEAEIRIKEVRDAI